jgi:hypothetical protein
VYTLFLYAFNRLLEWRRERSVDQKARWDLRECGARHVDPRFWEGNKICHEFMWVTCVVDRVGQVVGSIG